MQNSVDEYVQQAYEITTSTRARAAFDLAAESNGLRDEYGRTALGQRLLLARRLIEADVPFVTVASDGWDDHRGIYPGLKQRLPAVDQGVAALLTDLKTRGLLDETLVVVMGEFGRTPVINAVAGRDHWPHAFSVLIAGGGVPGGQAFGETDARCEAVKNRPVSPEELFHSIYVLLGIDPEKFLPTASGRDIQFVRDGQFMPELGT